MRRPQVWRFAVLVLLVFGFLWASEQDAQEADAALARYCDNVAQHVWPDYRGIARTACAER